MTMKIKLPNAVGEELERAQYPYRDSFDKYYYNSLKQTDSPTYHYIMDEPIQSNRNQRIVNLLNAWIDGWEEE
ncbi:hypothetical protein [Lapidilactobacillus bayanensis]|uniref:hypothetical protein n=1 Tax=Lapidilactobacillus bayanensis TaxID=2485998 RepID=UPI000F7A777F|nr:hypothetical protein [Lapidilactobacillus bayanensis]